ncbi:hypothetical protein [Lacinutrix chionoecetis]
MTKQRLEILAKPTLFKASILDFKAIGKIWSKGVQKGIPQSELKIPFTDEKEPTATLLYEVNNDTKHYFIPAYKIDVHRVSGMQQHKVQLLEASEGEGGLLKVSLKTVPSDQLTGDVNNAIPFDLKPSITLQFLVPSTKVEKTFSFQELVATDSGYDATLRVTNFSELSQISMAINDSAYNCKLLVKSSQTFGVPRFFSSSVIPNPILGFTKKETITVRQLKFLKIHLSVQNWDAYTDAFFKASPQLPPCGKNKNASRTWLEIYDDKGKRLYGYCAINTNKRLQDFSFAVPLSKPIPNTCHIVLWDRITNKRYTSNKINCKGNPDMQPVKSGERLYRSVAKQFTQELEFNLLEDTYLNLIGKKEHITEGYTEFHLTFPEDGSEHLYIQDLVSPEKFYFFPDHYVIARDNSAPFTPILGAEFVGEDLEQLKVTIDYRAKAYTNVNRKKNALQQLQNLPTDTKIPITLSLPPWGGNQFKFKLFLPKTNGLSELKNSLITAEHLQDIITDISLEDFQDFLNNLGNKNAITNLFTGHVEIDLPGIPIAPIPVLNTLAAVDASMLVINPQPSFNFQIEITNTSSKMLSAQGLLPQIQDGETIVDGSKINLQLPIILRPNASLTFVVVPKGIIQNPAEALVNLTWEGMKEFDSEGNTSSTTASFTVTNQSINEGQSFQVFNPTESIINATGIKVLNVVDGDKQLLTLKNVPSPIELNPGESFSFEAVSQNNISIGAENLVFEWLDFSAKPNLQNLYESIVDTSINNTYEKEITIQLHVVIQGEASPIRILKVLFKTEEDGPKTNELQFDASEVPNTDLGVIEKRVVLRQSLQDFVLDSVDSGSYWYKIQLIHSTDSQGNTEEIAGEWIKTQGDNLSITTDKLPKKDQE